VVGTRRAGKNGWRAGEEWHLRGVWWRVARVGGNGGMLVWVNGIAGLRAVLAMYTP